MSIKSTNYKFWDHKINPITGFKIKSNDLNPDKAKDYARKRKKYLNNL